MGGTCGDLITMLLDPYYTQTTAQGSVQLQDNRSRLKKPHLFTDDAEKDRYLEHIFSRYYSIPSHDLNYHIRRHHKFIGIAVNTLDAAYWAADRFKRLHRPEVWDQVMQVTGIEDTSEYAQMMLDFSNLLVKHTTSVLLLEDILAGNAIAKLTELGSVPASSNTMEEIYQDWLVRQIKYETMPNKSTRRS